MSPQHSVFSSPELLEQILLHLPEKDLLLAQRVSRGVQGVINTSPSIRQALFFIPPPTSKTVSPINGQPIIETGPNPLLALNFPCFLDNFDEEPGYAMSDRTAIQWCFCKDANDRVEHQREVMRTPAAMEKEVPFDADRAAAITRAGASWRRMLPVTPAPKAIRIVRVRNAMRGNTVRLGWLHGAGAGGYITMGQVYDLCAGEVMITQPRSHFCIAWHGSNLGLAVRAKRLGGLDTSKPDWRLGNWDGKEEEIAWCWLSSTTQCIKRPYDRDQAKRDFCGEDFKAVDVAWDDQETKKAV